MTYNTHTHTHTLTHTHKQPFKEKAGKVNAVLLLQLSLNMCKGLYCNLTYESKKTKYADLVAPFISRFI